jgi:hypothetical protein
MASAIKFLSRTFKGHLFVFIGAILSVLLFPKASLGLPTPNTVIQWNRATLQGVRDAKLGAPMVARALAVVHTCIYDAWAAYDERAVGTQLRGALRRPVNERTAANKQRAISFSAYRALADVLPVDTESVYKPLMRKFGYDPNDNSTDIETPTGIGNVTCAAVLEFRHHDKSNQLGDLAQGAYTDWSGYSPRNTPAALAATISVNNPSHWQPLTYVDSSGNLVLQRFIGAQWCYVTPFALSKGEEFRAALPEPTTFGTKEYRQQVEEILAMSANLNNREKMISEYWSDGPKSEQPPGHWVMFGEFVSARDRHSLDDDVKMFFVLTNAMMDASIAAWDAKRAYDSVRPITAMHVLYKGKKIRAWGGPGKGTVEMDGAQWMPYQLATSPTPPFPDFVSGHSAYSSAAARVLTLWTGSDRFGNSAIMTAGSSKIEPKITPATTVTLKWDTFTEAADEAGMSRRYGGIHFALADMAGRKLGRLVAEQAWKKAESYFDGTNALPLPTVNVVSGIQYGATRP